MKCRLRKSAQVGIPSACASRRSGWLALPLAGILICCSGQAQSPSNTSKRPSSAAKSSTSQPDELAARGYEILLQSAEAGVDLFVKKKRESLFVHFQGHPEYSTRTLLKEYRRDIKRFLRKEREAYPAMPQGYFDAATAKLLATFREGVVKNPREELLAKFPEAAVAGTLQETWQTSAASVYRNWLQYLLSKKTDASTLSAMTPAVRN